MSEGYTYHLTDEDVEEFLTGIVSSNADGKRESEAERKKDRAVGDWGEAVLYHHFSEELDDDKWEHVPDDEVDGNGWEYDFNYFTDDGKTATIDVKARQMWEKKGGVEWQDNEDESPDLLVRFDDSNEPRTHAHLYFLVELYGSGIDDVEKAVVKGFTTEEEVAIAKEFFVGDVFKTLVPQKKLKSINSLELTAKTTVMTHDIRGGHECMYQRMLNAEHADHDEDAIEARHDLLSCNCRTAKQYQRNNPEELEA